MFSSVATNFGLKTKSDFNTFESLIKVFGYLFGMTFVLKNNERSMKVHWTLPKGYSGFCMLHGLGPSPNFNRK